MKNKTVSPTSKKVAEVMLDFKEARLHIGKSGTIVTDRKQALAIALSEAEEHEKNKKR